VLCYHAISEDWRTSLAVTPTLLREQLTTLLRRGYRAERFTDMVVASGARRALAVTFDDAFRSVFAFGLPILAELGVPATVFVPTRLVGGGPMSWPGIEEWTGGVKAAELAGCSWDEIAQLAAAGWEIGSHTQSHPRLTTLSDDALDTELRGSKADCEVRLETPCRSLAYPYGDHDERVISASRRAGYEAACTLPTRLHSASALRYPRIYIGPSDDRLRFALKTAPAVLRLRRSAVWDLALQQRALRASR
jgi:peptidoglycan/xylan/chitin deacetylase (PgdA/CDA1 family)